MATVKVSENYTKAKSGQPPTGKFNAPKEMGRNPTVKRHFSESGDSPAKHHVASKVARTASKATPATRAANVAVDRGVRKGLQSRGPVKRASRGRRTLSQRGRAVGFPASDKRTASFIGKAADHSPALLAEFFAGLVIIGLALVTRTATEKYNDVVASVMGRYTAFTAVFFILYLMGSGSKRASQAAAWFGLLIDLGLLFDATKHNVFQDLTGMITGAGLPQGTKLLSSAKPEEFFATSDIKETTVQGGVVQSGGGSPAGGSPAAPAAPAAPKVSNPVASPVTGGTATPPPRGTGGGNGGVVMV